MGKKVMSVYNKIHTAVSLFKTPEKMIVPMGQNGLLNFLSDKQYLKLAFKAELGYPLNLEHPLSYNEKLQWLKLYDRKPEYIIYADKWRVREYIKRTIGEKYLVPLIGVYHTSKEIPWEKLPTRFALKCNHASGTNIICTDKNKIDFEKATRQLDTWLKYNAFWRGREWCYRDIEPCILCEEFLESSDGNTPDDYKFMCFNGEPRLIQVHHDRFGDHTLDFMDINWEKKGIIQGPRNSDSIIPKPTSFDEMKRIAEILSKGMYYARIDMYTINNEVKFGEITMYPTSGFGKFDNIDTDYLLGSWIRLPID